MSKQITVVLGGREYVLQEKHAGPHREWRDRLDNCNTMKIFKSLDGAMAQLVAAGDAIQEAWTKASARGADESEDKGNEEDDGLPLNAIIDLIRILPTVVLGVSGSMNEIQDLLFAYDGKLTTERKWILANAYDSEIVDAFWEIVILVNPTMALWGRVTGRKAHGTQSNSPSVNGASNGLPASGPKRKALTSS